MLVDPISTRVRVPTKFGTGGETIVQESAIIFGKMFFSTGSSFRYDLAIKIEVPVRSWQKVKFQFSSLVLLHGFLLLLHYSSFECARRHLFPTTYSDQNLIEFTRVRF